jgi:predicted TIM-barrel fold metal-dependent hydrolase
VDAQDNGFIDVNTCFGPDHGMVQAAGAPLAALVEETRRHGVRLALTSSLLAAQADLDGGNRLAVEAASDPANRLGAIAVVSAKQPGSAAAVVAAAEAAGVLGYRLDGGVWSFPTPEAVREVLRAVAPTGKPLLVPLSTVGGAMGFGEATAIGAATEGLGSAVILLGAHYIHVADDLRAAVRYPHLYLETSALAHWRSVETAVALIGADRLLLGTGSPRRPGASAIEIVRLARIPDDAKRAILAGNAARLFGLPAGPVDVTPPTLPARSWDSHTHHGPFIFDVPQVADADLVGELLTGPTSQAVASSAIGIFAAPAEGNDQAVAAAANGGPLGYVVADPHDLAFTEDQLRRHLGRTGMVGVKVHGEWSQLPTATPKMAALFDLLARFGRPVKIHNTGEDWADALLTIARKHPKLPIVIAHAGLGTPSIRAGELAAGTDNVYLEMCSSFASLTEVRRLVATAPVERVLWGSDAPLLDPGFVYGTYADALLSPEATERVFWSNAAALYGG